MDEAVFRAAVRRIFREQGFTAESMAQPKIRALVQATADIYMGAISPALESGVMPEVMAQHLREDVFVFSGFKTYRELREAADLLRDKNGLLKSFDRFYKDIAAIHEKYNRHWLKAEYIFAQASAEMAAKWVDFEKDGDEYDLQYRTANDDRVRYEHRVLHRVTLPTSDPFWEEFFPPNGWNCFVAGTPVLTAKGWVPIELIKKGDLVIGGSGKLRNVIGVHSKTVDDEVVSLFCKGFVTTSTKNHRFCTPSGWVQAEFLKPGDIVLKPGINTPFHLLVNAINNMIVILRYAFVSLERKRKTVSALAIDHKLKAWYKEIHDIFADKFTAFKWKAFICQIVRYYSFRFAKGSTDCTHTLRMNQSGKLGMFDRLGSYFRSKKRGTFLKLLSYIADKLAVFFSFSLSYMKPFGSKFMIRSGKPLSGILPASDIINPLSFHSLAAMSRCDIARHENTSDGSVVDLPMRTQPPITAKLGNIPEFNGINNIHAFDGFNSFFDFLCKTFFHNRYVMIEHKVISKKGKKEVYNLSVDVDESYIVPIGIAHNCRCTAVQVRKGKYPRSDSNTAIQQGREATYQAGKNGVNKAAIFRYNPGKQQVIFPPHHPYYEVSERERKAVKEALHPEEKEYTVIPTTAGRLRIHSGHGKGERNENIRVASYFTNKYGYEIDLLDNPDGVKSADSFNRTLGYEEEYKVNQTPSKNSIDRLIRDARKQADHIVLWIDSDISFEDLSASLRSRVSRSENIQTVTVVINGKDICLTRAEIVSEGFKIRLADLK